MLARTAPFRREMEQAFPDRPFSVSFWDGTELPSTNGGGPRFTVTSPQAVAHALRAPGQLGVGRAFAEGLLDVDDIDATIDLLSSWQPPALDRGAKLRLAAG